MALSVRPLEPEDLGEAAALCTATIPHLPFSPAVLRERIVDDPDFDPELNPVAWDGPRMVALACGAPSNDHLQTPGGVKLFAVLPAYRRQGLASRLFDRIEAALVARGTTESVAITAGNNRFMQGLDLRYTEALCFLVARGYTRAGDGMDMEVDLRTQEFDTRELHRELRERHRITLRRPSADDYQPVWDYVAREFRIPSALATAEVGRRWAYLATMGLRTPPSLHLAEQDGQPVGFAVTNVAAPQRLGPMAVSEGQRGRGVGKALLWRCLRDLKGQGLCTAVIYGAGPYSFYARTVGARVSAVFWRLVKPLAAE